MSVTNSSIYSLWAFEGDGNTLRHASGLVVIATGSKLRVDAATVPAAEDWLAGLDCFRNIGAALHGLITQADALFKRSKSVPVSRK